jgi:Na+/H+ antiporter NhaD/arsenite permease-like protein
MTAAEWSVLALVAAIIASCATKWNIGVLAIVLAWGVGAGAAGMNAAQVMAGFPVQLFLTLAGVTLLFTQAQVNGTLDIVAGRALRLCRGNAGLVPVVFFLLAALLSTAGSGSIAAAALLAPPAMAISGRAGIPAILMAILVCDGASAGSVSPFTPTGIIVEDNFGRIGLGGKIWQSWAVNFAAHAMAAALAYALFGGRKLFRTKLAEGSQPAAPAEPRHWITLAVVGVLMGGVIGAGVNVGLGALAGAAVLAAVRAASHADAIRKMPWDVILLVTGMTLLISVLERTEGVELFSDLLAQTATPGTITAVVAFVTGLVSAYSSTSGVVLPAFLPAVPGLAAKLGGGDPLTIGWSMIVGAHLVDVSPLSTIGALSLAAAPAGEDTRRLFNRLLAWGLSMAPLAALGCWIFWGGGL